MDKFIDSPICIRFSVGKSTIFCGTQDFATYFRRRLEIFVDARNVHGMEEVHSPLNIKNHFLISNCNNSRSRVI